MTIITFLVLLQGLFKELIALLPQIMLMAIASAITFLLTKGKYNADIKKILGEVDSNRLKDVITLTNFKTEQIEDLVKRNEKLEIACEKAQEALVITQALLKEAQQESMKFKAAYHIYKNRKI